MTVDDVIRRVAEIAAIRDDDEGAHCAEDSLHYDVLEAIATGKAEDPARCAAEAIKSVDIEFNRWCA